MLEVITASLPEKRLEESVIHHPAAPSDLRRHPRPAVAGKLQRDLLQGVTEFHVPIRPRWVGGKVIKSRPA